MTWNSTLLRGPCALALMAVTFAAACAPSYRGQAIEGTVVDDKTKEPIAGVAVVAEWLLEGGGFHPDTVGRLILQEAVTDQAGRFHLPAWGPIRPEKGHLERGSPRLNFYKRGYAFEVVGNTEDVAPYIKRPDPLISEWSGKTIMLKPVSLARNREGNWLELVGAASLLEREKCGWERMPHMTKELLQRRSEYFAQNVDTGLPSGTNLSRNGECADASLLLGNAND